MKTKANKILEIIKKKGIVLKMPETNYTNERIVIELYIKTLDEEEQKLLEEVLL